MNVFCPKAHFYVGFWDRQYAISKARWHPDYVIPIKQRTYLPRAPKWTALISTVSLLLILQASSAEVRAILPSLIPLRLYSKRQTCGLGTRRGDSLAVYRRAGQYRSCIRTMLKVNSLYLNTKSFFGWRGLCLWRTHLCCCSRLWQWCGVQVQRVQNTFRCIYASSNSGLWAGKKTSVYQQSKDVTADSISKIMLTASWLWSVKKYLMDLDSTSGRASQ